MARHTFAGGPSDYVLVTTSGTWRNAGPSTCTVWSAETGGTQVTDLLIDGQAVTAVRLGSTGRIPSFEGPDGVEELWLEVPGVPARVRLTRFGAQGPTGPGADVTGAEIEAARDEAQAAQVAAEAARTAAEQAAAAAEAGGTSTDAVMAARLADPGSLSRQAVAGTVIANLPDVSTGPEALRALILAGGVTPSRPMVIEGDSHAGGGNAPDFCTRLITPHGNPGRDLEGLVAGSVLPSLGNDGITIRQYLDQTAGSTKFDDVTALNPSVCFADIGTNSGRLGAMGNTVSAIRDALTPQYVEWIDKRRAASPDALIGFRLSAPFTTVATPLLTIDAQVFTTAMRQAVYAAARARPGTMVYDPQARLFGTTSPSTNTPYYNDAIHLLQFGYTTMADDFAGWVGAARPRSEALASAARTANPTQPWANYWREPEDTVRYAFIGEALITTNNADSAVFMDIGPSFPLALPGAILRGDLVEVVDAQKTVVIPSGATISASGANTRISNWSGGTGVTVAQRMLVRIWRRRFSTDATVNNVIADPSWRWKVIGRVGTTFATGFDVNAISTSSTSAVTPASEWVAKVASGDRLYIEGQGGTYIELAGQGTGTNQASVFGNAMRVTTGASGAAFANAIVVVVSSTHA